MIRRRLIHRMFGLVVITSLILSCKGKNSENQIAESDFEQVSSLKKAFQNQFLIGTALNEDQLNGKSPEQLNLVKEHFNSIVAENCMKSERLFVSPEKYDFSVADKFVAFGEENDMVIHGHTLIWHSQLPEWFFKDSLGNPISKKGLKERMKRHITTLVSRYKGKVKSWDVVNEAVLDNGDLRSSKFYEILGDEYIKLAFEWANQADPSAELYYNDYSTALPQKRAGIIKMVKKLQEQGVPISGIGMQGHLGLNHPDIAEFEASLLAFSDLGLKVSVTELDITVLPSPKNIQGADVSENFEYDEAINPYVNGLTDSIQSAFNKRYTDFFKLFLKHSDKLEKVTLWGVNDSNSWRNDWPVEGRTDYPLLFDRQNRPKTVTDSIIKMAQNHNK